MARYVVTITPEGEEAHGEATIRVDTGPSAPRTTEMTIRATSADGMSAVILPSIDLEGVVRALSAGVRAVPASVPTDEKAAAAPAMEPDQAAAGPADATRQPVAREASTVSRKTATSSRRKTDRPYRHMPAPKELRAIYEKAGTVTGVAEHYGVPRHTAQGWMARLRKLAD